jgi:hypothetical protein
MAKPGLSIYSSRRYLRFDSARLPSSNGSTSARRRGLHGRSIHIHPDLQNVSGLPSFFYCRVPAQEMVRHAAQITCQFIRLVRHCLAYKTPWRDALPLFQRRLDSYL